MNQLQQVNQSEMSLAVASYQTVQCDLCAVLDVATTATAYCMECAQHLCDRCTLMHRKQRSSQSHQVHNVNDMPSPEECIKIAVSYCKQHPSELIKLYCYDCSTVTCLMCYVETHNKHECCDIKKSAEKFGEQLKKDIEKLTTLTIQGRRKIDEIEDNKKNFLKDIVTTEKQISNKYDQVISLVQCHHRQIMDELSRFKDKRFKEIENRREEVEHKLVIAESFTRYCQEMKDKGSASDLSSAVMDLHTRGEELVKIHEVVGGWNPLEINIVFTSSPNTIDDVENMLGKLTFNGQNDLK